MVDSLLCENRKILNNSTYRSMQTVQIQIRLTRVYTICQFIRILVALLCILLKNIFIRYFIRCSIIFYLFYFFCIYFYGIVLNQILRLLYLAMSDFCSQRLQYVSLVCSLARQLDCIQSDKCEIVFQPISV